MEIYALLALLLATLVAAAITNYGAVRNTIVAASKVELFCARRAIDLLSLLPRYGSSYANHVVGTRRFLRVATTDSRCCGMASRLLLRAFPAAALALGSLIILLYIDPWVTMLLIVLSGLLSLLQYPIHLKTAAASRTAERTRSDFVKDLSRIVTGVDRIGPPAPDDTIDDDDDNRDGELSETNIHQYYQRLTYIELSSTSAQIASAVILCVAILALLLQTSFGTLNLATLLLYVATARQVLSNITKLLRTLTTISRLFPQISRYFRFIWSATDRWPLLIPDIEVRNASHKDERRAQKSFVAAASDTAPLEPNLIYHVFARQDLFRNVAAAVIDGLGLSEEAVRRYTPRFCLGVEPTTERRNDANAKPSWDIVLLRAGSGKVITDQVRTTIVISSYKNKDALPVEADLFVVLTPENRVLLQTPNRAAALARVEEELTMRPAEMQVGGDSLELEQEEM